MSFSGWPLVVLDISLVFIVRVKTLPPSSSGINQKVTKN